MEIIHQVRKLERYFIFSLIMSCLFSLRFSRDIAVLWLCLSEVKTPGPRGRHFLGNCKRQCLRVDLLHSVGRNGSEYTE